MIQEKQIDHIEQLRSLLTSSEDQSKVAALPFSPSDLTAGAENELQTVVLGSLEDVDLAQQIVNSSFYKNLQRRVEVGDAPPATLGKLTRYLESSNNIWQNSWVRIPIHVISGDTLKEFQYDLLKDKNNISEGRREDYEQFFIHINGKEFIRVPISYLLKMALIHVIDSLELPRDLKAVFYDFRKAFVSDNTSPETLSFAPVFNDVANNLSIEVATRVHFSQLLLLYAGEVFELKKHGQTALIYMSPHVPSRQQELNKLLPDSFYRDLFMNPCLSGWSKGYEKHLYMRHCHKVLSRSHLNAVMKLKDANILTNNLVILPNSSNASLCTNGTHISIGSKRLTDLRKLNQLTPETEKYVSDLLIKVVEHFLPLFVANYTAAPFRLPYENLHPEKILGFLAHELDYTHLRMLWRRWKKKAIKLRLGYRLTPFGPQLLDKFISVILRQKGDFVPDYRLVDYFMTALSTDQSPALNGKVGNADKLKKDLTAMGIFDAELSLYALFKERSYNEHGFSGFEGRFYSLFPSLSKELPQAIKLQALVTAFAFKKIINGEITHEMIPNSPTLESERRQVFFDAAVGLPTFYVKTSSKNLFLQSILKSCKCTRKSNRYKGYTRIYLKDYQSALIELLEHESELMDSCSKQQLSELREKVTESQKNTSNSLAQEVLETIGSKSVKKVPAEKFNVATEAYYQDVIRKRHFDEGANAINSILMDVKGNPSKLTLERDYLVKAEAAYQDSQNSKSLLKTISTALYAIYHHQKKSSI